MTFGMPLRAVCWKGACVGFATMVQPDHSVLPPKGNPEFHAEWLRDGPCDATTTCLGNPGVWCQLSSAAAENMRFGGRFSTLDRSGSQGYSNSFRFAHPMSRSRARVSAVARAQARDL